MYKQSISQKSNQKKSKNPKEIKLLPNYIPIKKNNFQSNISENETEPSIQKNFSNKNTKRIQKQNLQAKSVQIVHSKQFSPKLIFNSNTNKRLFSKNNKLNSNHGSFYNINYLNNIYDYSNEKKIIENKNKKINTLRKQLSLYIQQINILEKNNEIFSEFQNNIKDNISQISSNNSHSANKKNPKILYINKNNNNKCLLINNNSYVGYPSNNEQKINGIDNANKKLEKKLSNLLTENNSDNNFINKKNNYIKENNNILNIIYQSKKGGCRYKNININKNNYNNIDNKKINPLNNNNQAKIKKEISFKNNNYRCFEQQKNNVYLYTNKESIQKIPIIENKNNNNENKNISKLDNQYKILNEKVTNLFNILFDYYNKKIDKEQ